MYSGKFILYLKKACGCDMLYGHLTLNIVTEPSHLKCLVMSDLHGH